MLTYTVKNQAAFPWSGKRRGSPLLRSQHPIIQRMLRLPRAQTTFAISAPQDASEQEADRVARDVMRIRETNGQIAPIQRGEVGGIDQLHRQPLEEEEDRLQSKAKSGHRLGNVPNLSAEVATITKGGRHLSTSEQAFFEPRMGYDFGAVRIHTDVDAQRSARRLNARAYTVGSDIVFGRGEYEPQTKRSRELMAHELTHVIQQRAALRDGPFVQRDDQPAVFPDFPKLLTNLNEDVRENVRDNAHHFFRVYTLYPDRPDLLEDTFFRYALGANVLSTAFQFADISPEASDVLAPLTGKI